MTIRMSVGAAVAAAIVAASLAAFSPAATAQSSECPSVVDETKFAGAGELEQLTRRLNAFGLRTPGSPEHEAMLEILEAEFGAIPGMQVTEQPYKLTQWQPTPRAADGLGRDIGAAGTLAQVGPNGKDVPIPVASAIAFSRPTSAAGRVGEVVYLPLDVPITAENAKGKVVVRDLRKSSVPYAALTAVSHFSTPDYGTDAAGSYSRTYLTASFTEDIEAAAVAGAVGFVRAFDLPTEQMRGYYSSHNGTLQQIPGVWVGADERDQLKQIAADHGRVRIGVKAEITPDTPTRNVIATIPGQSATEKIVIVTNSDGNSWVQENGSAALIPLARYLAALPIECRPKTIEFVLSSAHLGYNQDGFTHYIKDLENRDKLGEIFFGMGVEHLGAREVNLVDRAQGPGQELAMSGKTEPYAFFAPSESPVISNATVEAVARRSPSRTGVLRGLDVPPPPGRVPVFCSFGGLANEFQFRLIPSIGGISGPETMWNTIYGIGGLDFEHMRKQILVVGDVLLALHTKPREAVEGAYPQERAAVAAGAETCDPMYPKLVGPGTPAEDDAGSPGSTITGTDARRQATGPAVLRPAAVRSGRARQGQRARRRAAPRRPRASPGQARPGSRDAGPSRRHAPPARPAPTRRQEVPRGEVPPRRQAGRQGAAAARRAPP